MNNDDTVDTEAISSAWYQDPTGRHQLRYWGRTDRMPFRHDRLRHRRFDQVNDVVRPRRTSGPERVALAIALSAVAVFGVYGFATGASSTVAYLVAVSTVGVLAWRLRRTPVSGSLAIALAVQAVAHLAGGLVRVGHDVLYNASISTYVASLHTHVLQYDHLVHAFGSSLATMTVWTLLAAPQSSRLGRRDASVLCALAGLGVGGINETVEFLATIAYQGTHTGGYTNTGWDLVCNSVGAFGAACVLYWTGPSRATVT